MADKQIIPPSPTAEQYAMDEDQGAVFTEQDPIDLFKSWLTLAGQYEINDPNAMSLATVDGRGRPDCRIVLLKDVSPNGFSFYSNTGSAKGEQLAHHRQAALCFHWKSIRRQVRIRGKVRALEAPECDDYFATRSRGSQIGAWASFQSRPMETRKMLEQRIADYEEIYKDRPVPRPDHWQGWQVIPQEIEFWVNRPFRLHDRLLFEQQAEGWVTTRLYP
ncbi:MAG: pyridoxamine 5'-phosphate oxidase [bacterium]